MLQNAYFLAKIGADEAANEQHFAEMLPIGRRAPAWTAAATQRRGPGQSAQPQPGMGRATAAPPRSQRFLFPRDGLKEGL